MIKDIERLWGMPGDVAALRTDELSNSQEVEWRMCTTGEHDFCMCSGICTIDTDKSVSCCKSIKIQVVIDDD